MSKFVDQNKINYVKLCQSCVYWVDNYVSFHFEVLRQGILSTFASVCVCWGGGEEGVGGTRGWAGA